MEEMNQLREENKRLKRAVEELSVLNELATAIGASGNFEDVVRKIISRSMKAVRGEQGLITLVEEKRDIPMKTLVRTTVSSSEHPGFHFNEALLGWMILNKKPLTLNAPRDDERFHGVVWNGSVRSVTCVPLLIRSVLKGVLAVYNKKSGTGFTEDDQRLLAIIASQSAQVIENARLSEEERALFQIQHEMKLASQIQMDLLPKEAPVISGYDIAGATFPAKAVGGDYYDFVQINERKLAVCLGDVAGKGLPAALLAANLQALIRGRTDLLGSVHECVCRLNRDLVRSTGAESFATLFYGILDSNEHTLTYCNAGQEPPFLLTSGGEPFRLRDGGPLVGMLDDVDFAEAKVSIEKGDVLVVYSDGVTEAMDEMREQFGERKLSGVILENAGLSASEIIKRIVDAVVDHAGKAPQHDDITAVVIRRLTA